MKGFVAFAALFAVAAGTLNPGIRVKFDMVEGLGESYFYSVPSTLEDAKAQGWRQYRRPAGPLPQLSLYCMDDKVFCVMFDDTGYVAGLQVAINEAEFKNNPFDWHIQGYTKWNTAVGSRCTTFWTIQQYFVNEDTFLRSREERLAARDPTRILQEGGVWVTGTNRELLKISNNEEDIKESIFTTQACLPWMGNHYYYNMTDTTPCTSEGVYSWFPMATEGELFATGFLAFGQLPENEQGRDWFERPNGATVAAIVPYGSECLYDMTQTIGALTMHIYYVDNPWDIGC